MRRIKEFTHKSPSGSFWIIYPYGSGGRSNQREQHSIDSVRSAWGQKVGLRERIIHRLSVAIKKKNEKKKKTNAMKKSFTVAQDKTFHYALITARERKREESHRSYLYRSVREDWQPVRTRGYKRFIEGKSGLEPPPKGKSIAELTAIFYFSPFFYPLSVVFLSLCCTHIHIDDVPGTVLDVQFCG